MAVNPPGSSGTTLDTNAIVAQLMAVERKPLLKIKAQETAYQTRISAYAQLLNGLGTFKSAVAALEEVRLDSFKASLSDSSFFTVTLAPEAAAGAYNLKVKNLAAAQSLYSASFASPNSEVADLSGQGTQKLRLQAGGREAREITVSGANNSLVGLKDAINQAGAGIKASVIHDGGGFRLTLSAGATGAADRMVLKVAEDGVNYTETGEDIDALGLSRLAFNPTYDPEGNVTGGIAQMTQSQAALDAKLKIEGLEVARPGNTIKDLIAGVTINLLKGDNYQSNVLLTVSRDQSAHKTRVNAFVTAYNQAVAGIKSLRGDAAGALRADSTLGAIPGALRAAVTASYLGKSLAFYGLTHDRSGVLTLDDKKFAQALAADEPGLVNTLNAMRQAMEALLSNYEKSVLPARKQGYQDAMKNLQRTALNMERKLDLTEAALKKKYIALDAQLNRFQSTSDYFKQQMDALAKSFGGK